MSKQPGKIDFADINFDDVIGDGLSHSDEGDGKGDDNKGDGKDGKPDPKQGAGSDDGLEDNKGKGSGEEDDDDDDDKGKGKSDEGDGDDDGDKGKGGDDNGEEETLVGSIAKALGYEVDEEFEDTEEGLIELTKQAAASMAEEQIEDLFKKFPTVKNHMDFLLAGGDPDKFFEAFNPNNDLSAVEFDKDDARTQKAVVTEFFKKKGHDEEFIKETISDYEDTGKLYDKALNAKKQLAALTEKERARLVQEQKEAHEQAVLDNKKFWEGVADTIDKGKEFAGITIPEKEKSKFFEYISAPIDPKTGKTKRDADYEKAQLDVKLAMDYLMFKGFKLKDIIQAKVRTAAAGDLRDKIKKSGEGKVGGSGPVDKVKKFDADRIDFSAFR